ncbi:MAG: exodeoxyribonuclease VII small subunit [Chloroflexi bacterium]|nr:exodeoxyribonuclease VII small subunit [Chloroflexota bacterium]
MNKALIPIAELTYEQAFAQLENIVNTLEADEQTLDEILAKFERGQALARHCATLLEGAELKVKQLSGDELADFEPGR